MITVGGTGRVLIIAGWWPSGTNVAGIFIKEHVQATRMERDVEVIYMEVEKGPWPLPSTRTTFAMEDGIPVHRVHIATPLRRFGMYERLARNAYNDLVARLHQKTPFDLIHMHVRTDVTEQVMHVAEMLDLKVVLTEQNSFYHLGIRKLAPPEQASQRKAIKKWLGNDRIAAVMPVSNDLGNVLHRDYGVQREKITVVPNIAADVFQPLPKPSEKPYVIMLAAVWRPPKDHDVFIAALHRMPPDILDQCRVEWVGYGPNYQLIQDRCNKELPHVDIRFPGYMDKPAMARAMQKAHVFVLPTLADNLPCVVIEALCCGTPVVSMAVNGVPELVNSTNGILVPAADDAALADALTRCINGTANFDNVAIAEAALARYTSKAVARQIYAVHGSVVLSSI